MTTVDRFPESDGRSPRNEVAVPQGTGVLDEVPWLVLEFDKAQRAKEYWDKRLEELRDALRAAAGEHEALVLNGETVFTYEYINQFRGKDFAKAYPDLAKVYERERTITELDVDLLKVGQPEKYKQFQTRALKRKV